LWITDGTAAGTHELTSGYVFPSDITVAGSKAFFAANTGGLLEDLWVTDGTVAATQELTVSGGVGNSPQNLTAFGNKVIFTAADVSTDLLVSDGTSSGSFALNLTGSSPRDFVVLGNKVLFEAEDTSNKLGLWVTDGTSAGTSEIPVPDAYFDGVFAGIASFTAAVIGNDVVFSGENSLEEPGLWVTDGTASGNTEIVSPLSVSDLTAVPTRIRAATSTAMVIPICCFRTAVGKATSGS